jgi:DeoR family suf operon transcriptional repressor
MNVTGNRRLLTTTRGKILTMLREDRRTVAQMAKALHITENGIRAQLNALEKEGLVQQAGVLPGTRKPFNAYELTAEGERIFPSAYGPMMCEVLNVIGERCTEHELNDICEETARRVAQKFAPEYENVSFEQRMALALRVLHEMGGAMELTASKGKVVLSGKTCPIGELVKTRPRTCHLVERLIASITGTKVVEKCDKGPRPRCCFEISKN